MAGSIDFWQSSQTFFMAEREVSLSLQNNFPQLENHLWIKTSGSSGQQKWVALGKSAILASAESVNKFLKSNKEDVWGLTLPDYHVGGLAIRARAHLSGAKLVDCRAPSQLGLNDQSGAALSKWSPLELIAKLEREEITLFSLVPTQLHDVVLLQLNPPKSLRAVFIGGGYLNDRLHHEAVELGWPLIMTYGMTETASQICASNVADKKLRCLSHAKIRIESDSRVSIEAKSLFSGYAIVDGDKVVFDDPKVDGWYLTSDLGELTGDVFRWLGRADRCVKSKGVLYNLDMLEIELSAALEGELKNSFFIYAISDSRLENEIVVVVLKEAKVALEKQLQNTSLEHSQFLKKCRVVTVAEFKKTSVGKLDRIKTISELT